MNYKMIENEAKYCVVENSKDGEVVGSYPDRDTAKAMMRHLNFGGAFDGFTPSFFLNTEYRKVVKGLG